MKRLAMAVCAGALGITLVACGGGGAATDEAATTQEVATDATEEVDTEATKEVDEVVADESAGTAEDPEVDLSKYAKSMLYPLVNAYSAKEGMHMAYSNRMTYAGEDGAEDYVMNLAYDMHIKGKTAFWRTTSLDDPDDSIWNGTSAIWDGNLVKLDDETHTGKIVVADYVSGDNEDDILWQAVPFNEAYVRSLDSDFTVEEREVEGTTYTVEVHPQVEDYIRQEAFYFDEDGNLAYLQIYRLGPDDSDPEQFFTIESWDKNVDESLLDLSGYEFSELEY